MRRDDGNGGQPEAETAEQLRGNFGQGCWMLLANQKGA